MLYIQCDFAQRTSMLWYVFTTKKGSKGDLSGICPAQDKFFFSGDTYCSWGFYPLPALLRKVSSSCSMRVSAGGVTHMFSQERKDRGGK